MFIKKTLIAASLATALGLIAGAPLALASDRDDSPNAHQTRLDEQFARGQSGLTTKSGTNAYAYVPAPKHHAARK
jgi:hypothetical protein